MSGRRLFAGKCLVPGEARGPLSVMTEPLSLWGGFDLESGRVADVNHPQHEQMISGRVLAMPGGRGSSSSSSILLESARQAVHPHAIILAEPDPILVIGALVAEDLYGVTIPVIVVPEKVLGSLHVGAQVIVSSGGKETVLVLLHDGE